MNPTLSILVATRNRIPYCMNLIETILSFSQNNFELVIQDNSDSLELSEFAKSKIQDNRLIYNHTPPPFSSIDNFNAVIGLASGEYLCMIGDDDGVTHEIFTLVEWMKKNSIDAVNPKLNVMYRWPDACNLLSGYHSYNGHMSLFNLSGSVTIYNSKKERNKLISEGGQNYLSRNLPKPYHGIIIRSAFDNLKKISGVYVGGLSPDIYMAVSLSYFIKSVYCIDYPLIISGVCKEAVLGHLNRDKIGVINNAPHLRDRGNYLWDEQIPTFYCAENIWADSMLCALKDLKMQRDTKKFNYKYLYYSLLRKYSEKKNEIYAYAFKGDENSFVKLKIEFQFLLFMIRSKLNKIMSKLIRLFLNNNRVQFKTDWNNILNIQSAVNHLTSFLIEKNKSLKKIVK